MHKHFSNEGWIFRGFEPRDLAGGWRIVDVLSLFSSAPAEAVASSCCTCCCSVVCEETV